jgi:hypothetical protein
MWTQIGEGQMMMRSFVEDYRWQGQGGGLWLGLRKSGSHRRSIASRINRARAANKTQSNAEVFSSLSYVYRHQYEHKVCSAAEDFMLLFFQQSQRLLRLVVFSPPRERSKQNRTARQTLEIVGASGSTRV